MIAPLCFASTDSPSIPVSLTNVSTANGHVRTRGGERDCGQRRRNQFTASLCGVLLRKFACELTGVDLSSGMLAKAHARAVYDTLTEAELSAFLVAHPDRFDVIASADTLCYFGDLAPTVRAAAAALRTGGWLAFTVERADDVDGYRINPHGRYSHAARYIEQLLQDAAFADIDIAAEVLRREAGAPVNGWVVRARRGD